MTLASDILASKISIPSELRTRQWAALPAWIRERAYFMAGVDRAEILDLFRQAATKVEAGTMTIQEARKELRMKMLPLEYEPLPGQEGTIKDLRTVERQNVSLETNIAMVQGFARWAEHQDPDVLQAFPAQRLVRMRLAKQPRNWGPADKQNAESKELVTRWTEALAKCGMTEGATGADEMAALVNHPVWVALSRFGLPYPPFDFNSSMDLEPLDSEEAKTLGLMPGTHASAEHKSMLEPQDRGLNETLEATPAVRDMELRAALADNLDGLAEWDGDKLVFTDPNGTRPYSGDQLVNVWLMDLPPGIEQFQRDAFREFLINPDAPAEGHLDEWSDVVRAIMRIEPLPGRHAGIRDMTPLAELFDISPHGFEHPMRIAGRDYMTRTVTSQNGRFVATVALEAGREQ